MYQEPHHSCYVPAVAGRGTRNRAPLLSIGGIVAGSEPFCGCAGVFPGDGHREAIRTYAVRTLSA
jgi:hypothetical protein